jgi:hypothetical protein
MIDFVFYIGNLDIARKSSHKEMVTLIFNYALLLKDKLSLWMFVPCDKDGKIMEEPQSIKHIYSKAIMETSLTKKVSRIYCKL